MNGLLNSNYQTQLLKKWSPIIRAGEKIESRDVRVALAQVLENTNKDFVRNGLLSEATGSDGALGAVDGSNGVMSGAWGTAGAGTGNNFMPNIVMPLLRRIFPTLIAHELCGVQPLNGPIGFAMALRAKYAEVPANHDGEIGGVKAPVVGYTGVATEVDPDLSAYIPSDGTGFGLGQAEFANIYGAGGEMQYPMATFDLIKSGVEAKTRKLAAHWSPELAEDMEVMHGVNVETEMVNILSFEIGAEIDRQIVAEMIKAAVTGNPVVTWNPGTADGLNQLERTQTLLAQITVEANNIALSSRRGNGNFVIASPKVTGVLEQLSLNKFVSMNSAGEVPSVPAAGIGAIQKKGLINDGQQLLVRDSYATADYALVGYKGQHPGDSGIIYCPYIPVKLSKVLQPGSFTPSIGARTRYGLMNNPFDAKNYYRLIKVEGINETYTLNSSRKFLA